MRVAVTGTPFTDAVMVTVCVEPTAEVSIVYVACDVADDTDTDPGSVATEVLELDSATTVPDGPDLPFKLTVAVTVLPPETVEGFRVMESTHAGSRVNTHVFVVEPKVAVIVTGRFESTPSVWTVKVMLAAPAGTVTYDGTTTLGFPELRDTANPPTGAGDPSVTLPVG